jgi:hypothetical protein
VAAKYVKIDIAGNWSGGVVTIGLTVRFLVPVTVRETQPASGARRSASAPLASRPRAGTHKVYVGDPNAVPAGTAAVPFLAEF